MATHRKEPQSRSTELQTGFCFLTHTHKNRKKKNANYAYDDDWECYVCMVNMDEDDYVRLLQSGYRNCPYYRNGDEYRVVRHQM